MGLSWDGSIAVSSAYVVDRVKFELGILKVKILNKSGIYRFPVGHQQLWDSRKKLSYCVVLGKYDFLEMNELLSSR